MTEENEPDQSNRDLVERFFAASERGDADVVATLVDDEMVMEWPQSGERFAGRTKVLAAMGAIEVKPTFAGEPRLVGSGNLWVLMLPPLRRGRPPVRCRARAGGWEDPARHRLLGRPVPSTGIASNLRRP